MTEADVRALLARHAALREEQNALLTVHDTLKDRVDKLDEEIYALSGKMTDIHAQVITDELVLELISAMSDWEWNRLGSRLTAKGKLNSPILAELRDIHHRLYKTVMNQTLHVRLNAKRSHEDGDPNDVDVEATISGSNLNIGEMSVALQKLGFLGMARVVRNRELARLDEEAAKVRQLFAYVDEVHDA